MATSTANTDRTAQATITVTNNAAPSILTVGQYSTSVPDDVDIHYSLGAGGLGAQAIDRVRVGPLNTQLGSSEYTVDTTAKVLTIKQATLAAVGTGSSIAFDVRFDDTSQTVRTGAIGIASGTGTSGAGISSFSYEDFSPKQVTSSSSGYIAITVAPYSSSTGTYSIRYSE
jgi:hypothetical protein